VACKKDIPYLKRKAQQKKKFFATHTYSWKWIGLNPNLIGFWRLDSTGFGSNWIWISTALDELGLDSIG